MARNPFAVAAAIAATVTACIPVKVPAPEIRETADIGSIPQDGGALKLHMLDGSVYRFETWLDPNEVTNTIAGTGALFGIDRGRISEGQYVVSLDSVVLIGIDRGRTIRPFGLSFLTTMTTLTTIVTIACVADPKSCFGSCPTFYLAADDSDRPVAEGFSASIARSLEAVDIDRLGITASGGDTVVLEMRNEALETQAIRYARLLAVPTDSGADIVVDAAGSFFEAHDVARPLSCRAIGGDCSVQVAAPDLVEYSSLADSADLGARETVELAFVNPGGPVALVLEARQTFVSTFLIYQAMAYMGNEAEYWLAALERGDAVAHSAYRRLMGITGAITVSVQVIDGSWEPVGEFAEAGPIATDVQAVLVPAAARRDTVRVRLEMARGSWRIGYAALASVRPAGPAVAVEPLAFPDDDTAFAALRDVDRHLITQPGDSYRLAYVIPPDGGTYEVFLETRGFYYEWMRREWLDEEDPAMTALLFGDPGAALRVLAPEFKRREPGFEESFWHSRFGRQP